MSDEASQTIEKAEEKPEGKAEERAGGNMAGLQRNYQKALDEVKKEREQRKAAEAQVAALLPYKEKLAGTEEAKALEAQREAEARAKQESDSRASRELGLKRENAQLRAIAGVVPPKLVNYALYLLNEDQTIAHDPETGGFTGLDEAVARITADELFAVMGSAPVKKAAPGLPVTTTQSSSSSKKYTTIAELDAEGPEAVLAYQLKCPDEYAALRAAHNAALLKPRRQMMPTLPAPQR